MKHFIAIVACSFIGLTSSVQADYPTFMEDNGELLTAEFVPLYAAAMGGKTEVEINGTRYTLDVTGDKAENFKEAGNSPEAQIEAAALIRIYQRDLLDGDVENLIEAHLKNLFEDGSFVSDLVDNIMKYSFVLNGENVEFILQRIDS